MSLFEKIKEKLGMGGVSNEAHKTADPANTAHQASTDSVIDSTRPTTASNATTAPPANATTPGNTFDVSAKLDNMAATHGEPLNWRGSIVDLLKLLGLESSLESRRELATELGCPADKMADSAQMNVWLHQTVMRKLAENGGAIPPELLS